MLWDDPRSTWSHWGSENALDHRVPVFPSTAADAGNDAFSAEEAVAVLSRARFVVPQPAARAAGTPPGMTSPDRSSNRARTARMAAGRNTWRNRRRARAAERMASPGRGNRGSARLE